MNQRAHKTISAGLNLIVVLGSFEGLIAILNFNQPEIFVRTAFYVGFFYILQIVLLYDLHFKSRGSLQRARLRHQELAKSLVKSLKIFSSAFWDRCQHLRRWNFFSKWLNYLVLPGLIFWATISIIFINFGTPKIQQIFVVLSTLALYLNYWYLKEIFSRGKEVVDRDVFVILSMVKIYAGAIVFGAIIALVKRYCLDASFAILATFCCTFFLIYQALFQHRLINIKNIFITLLISLIIAFISWGVLIFWGYNYFTAAIFMAACYNLFWGVFHYHLDQALTWAAFWEILIIGIIIASMVISVTNFKARILDDCRYSISF